MEAKSIYVLRESTTATKGLVPIYFKRRVGPVSAMTDDVAVAKRFDNYDDALKVAMELAGRFGIYKLNKTVQWP